jgi:alpha-amylase
MGGDMAGITQKIKEGYFDDLGVNAIWFSPVLEQIHDSTDEGTGNTYAFHGYWTKDWTQFDPNFGTEEDFKALIDTAHEHGIRILMDVVMNHTGPVTEKDPVWDETWVRTGPGCTYRDQDSAVSCTLVANLPDILTNSEENVSLPTPLVAKWKAEGRYDEEMKELDAFFKETGLVRSPKNYIIKWLTIMYVNLVWMDIV